MLKKVQCSWFEIEFSIVLYIIVQLCITNENALFSFALSMILHYSLAILNTNDNALSLLFFANAPMSTNQTVDYHVKIDFPMAHVLAHCVVSPLAHL